MAEIISRPRVSITNVIFSFDQTTKQLVLLLLQRTTAPDAGSWGLPTTWLRADESAEDAARRLVREKIGVRLATTQVEQLGTFTNVTRVSGERTLALTYMVYLPGMPTLTPGYGAKAAAWFAVLPRAHRDDLVAQNKVFQGVGDNLSAIDFYAQRPGELTADHGLIIRTALRRVRNRLDYAPTILNVLGATFTLKQAREVYAILWRVPVTQIDNSNFRKTYGQLFQEVGEVRPGGSGRPAKLYRLS